MNLIKSLFLFFYIQPLTLFQIAIFIKHPSWWNFALIIIAYLINLFFIGSDSLSHIYEVRRNVWKGFVEIFQKCNYKRFTFYDFNLGGKAIEKAKLLSHPGHLLRNKYVPNYAFNKKGFFDIFVVDRGTSKVLPFQLASYAMPFYGAYLFVRDEPSKITLTTKFFICHEIGHLLNSAVLRRSILNTRNKPLYLFIVWCLCSIVLTKSTFVLITLLLLILLVSEQKWKETEYAIKIDEEITADAFALDCLNESEKNEIKSKYLAYYPPMDSQLTIKENSIRKDAFLEMLNEQEKIDEHLYSRYSYTPNLLIYSAQLIITLIALWSEYPNNNLYSPHYFVGIPVMIYYVSNAIKVLGMNDKISRVIERVEQKKTTLQTVVE